MEGQVGQRLQPLDLLQGWTAPRLAEQLCESATLLFEGVESLLSLGGEGCDMRQLANKMLLPDIAPTDGIVESSHCIFQAVLDIGIEVRRLTVGVGLGEAALSRLQRFVSGLR